MLLLTLVSLTVAVVMSFVAWRATTEERRRSDARVEALAEAIHQPIDLDLKPARQAVFEPAFQAPQTTAAAADLFAPASADEPAGRWGVAVAAGGLVVATLAAGAILFSGEAPPASTTSQAAAQPAAAVAAAPLELVALAHERAGDSLIVRGVVRNPRAGSEVDRLVAVVFLFNPDGGFLTSGRAPIESNALIPGGESTFVVSVPVTAEVGRYRVSFRVDDRVISHVDKRTSS
jgi:hypothetical protein